MRTFKKVAALLLVITTLLSFAACGKAETPTEPSQEETEPTTMPADLKFPNGTKILGIDVGQMDASGAFEAVNGMLAEYSLAATVNGKHFTISAADVQLQVTQESITKYLQALENGNAKEPAAEYDEAMLRERIAAGTGSSVVEAKVVYDKSSQSFKITKESSGYQVDTYAAADVLGPALAKLETSGSCTVTEQETEPTRKSTDTALINAAKKANAYLSVSITYVYAPENVASKSQAVTKNDIGAMIVFDSAMNPSVSAAAVNNYAVAMNDKYCVRDKFQTTGGTQMNVNVGAVLQAVDVQALAADLKGCLEKGISGTRQAPYGKRVEAGSGYGSSYVEVDLTGQHLYVYKNGACVVSTPIVSGCVANGTKTITGVFSIYVKSRNVTLTGPGYSSPVKYWMPFSGGYGLHDANWRSNFGGEIYLYDGSHGCVNIPPAVAGQVWDNVSVGTKVIIYGGAASVKERPQKLTAVTEHNVTPESAAFDLNVTYLGAPTLTYTSSNPSVATVSKDGKVTVKGVGKTTITVDAPAHGSYLAGKLTITINVAYNCGNNHQLTWTTTKEPTCAPGEQTGTCKCGYTETKEVPAVKDHEYAWTTTKAPTCEAGEKTGKCKCGATVTETLAPVADHTYGEWITTTQPGCETAGTQSSTCSGCGDVKTQTLPALEHDFSGGDVCANGCGTTKPAPVEPDPETP